MGKDEFIGIVVRVAWGSEDTAIDENLVEIVYIYCTDLSRLLDEQDVLLKERVGTASPKENRNFSAQVWFCEG